MLADLFWSLVFVVAVVLGGQAAFLAVAIRAREVPPGMSVFAVRAYCVGIMAGALLVALLAVRRDYFAS